MFLQHMAGKPSQLYAFSAAEMLAAVQIAELILNWDNLLNRINSR